MTSCWLCGRQAGDWGVPRLSHLKRKLAQFTQLAPTQSLPPTGRTLNRQLLLVQPAAGTALLLSQEATTAGTITILGQYVIVDGVLRT